MKEVFFVVEEALEGGYTAKALGESIFTEARDNGGASCKCQRSC